MIETDLQSFWIGSDESEKPCSSNNQKPIGHPV